MRRTLVLLVVVSLASFPLAAGSHAGDADASRSVTFEPRNGNEWWVQVRLSGADAGSVVRVEAQDTGGAWKELTKRDWGDWAASFHVEPGHEVRYVAHFGDGGHVTSCWMTHPEGVETTCPDAGSGEGSGSDGGSGGDAGAFDFSPRNGNEWWVQVKVAPEPAAVQAMDTGGAWVDLTKRSWGDWAASFHVEPGHEVRFRAHGGDGAWSESCWFTHPEGAATTCPDGGDTGGDGGTGDDGTTDGFSPAFRTPGGNEWWVEVYVDADRPLAGVDARVVGGEWRALSHRSWGAWAASFRVPDGSLVEFRARATDGANALSADVYRWPSGERVEREDGDAWPREGSYVRYLLDSGEGVPGWSESTMLWQNLTYTGGAWSGTCEGWRTSGPDGNKTTERLEFAPALRAPRGPTDNEPGEHVLVQMPSCSRDSPAYESETAVYVAGRGIASGYHGTEKHHQHGEPVDVPVWRGSWEDDGCPCQWRSLAWHTDTGLLVNHVTQYRYSAKSSHLVDTDAPISPAETSAPPEPAWPREGSFAEYEVTLTSEYSDAVEVFDVRFEYVGGEWRALCRGEVYEARPSLGPTGTSPGEKARPTQTACRITPPAVEVQGRFPEDTTRDGQPHRAMVWWGDEFDDRYGDEDAWWDVETGLLLRWEDHGGYFRGDAGRLTDTDAPLSSA